MACPTKSLQFRTIAPKVPSSVVGPAVLSCQPSLPDAQATGPKSIIMPAQKYALMQVASQEGTFSLVALSPPVTPQSPQQIQRNKTFPKNMKLPIPRYQSVRNKHTPEKAAAAQTAHMFTPAKHVTQAFSITSIFRSNSTDSSDDPIQSQEEQAELQIKCGRCQTITPTFADMKLHLLYVHGDEIQVRLKDGVLQGGREAESELVKHAAHYWKQLNEKRNLVKCGSCKEEFYSFSKLKKHIYSHHQGEPVMKVDSVASENTRRAHAQNTSPELLDKSITLRAELGYNCILCTGVLASKEELFDHWQSCHNCEDPAVLWTVVRLKDGVLQGGREAESELVKHAAHYWKQLNEKRNLVKCGSCKEEFYSFSKLKKHIYSHHQGESAMKVDSAASENTHRDHAQNTSPQLLDKSITLRAERGFNCILCTGVLASKEELFDHWQSCHNCEDPAVLWTVVSSFMEREEVKPSSENPEK
ncbi:UNVERIFIED_CONTAM: hypothetical protein FKN15_041520 [Acipenser sinensis]